MRKVPGDVDIWAGNPTTATLQIRVVKFDAAEREHKITFSFVNDFFSKTHGDRNLYVRSPVLLVISE